MPIDSLNMIGDSECNQYKSRKNSLKFKTGHTYRRLNRHDLIAYNKHHIMKENNTLNMNEIAIIDNEKQITISRIKKANNLNNKNFFTDYSLNKKKRWLLPDILKEKVKQIQELKEDADEKKAISFRIGVFVHEKATTKKVLSYFDTNGRIFSNRTEYMSVLRQAINLRGIGNRSWRRANKRLTKIRKVDLKKYFAIRKIFKNGNRNRNSGIKRANEVFEMRQQVNQDELNEQSNLEFHFGLPDETFHRCKVWRSGKKQYKGVLSDYTHRSNKIKGFWFLTPKLKRFLNHEYKQKKNCDFFNSLNSEKADYFEEKALEMVKQRSQPNPSLPAKRYKNFIKKHKMFTKPTKCEDYFKVKRPSMNHRFKLNDLIHSKFKQPAFYHETKAPTIINETNNFKNLKIIVDENDELFFKYIKIPYNNTDEQNITATSQPTHFNFFSLFDNFDLKVRNKLKFLDSIEDLLLNRASFDSQILLDSVPSKLLINLERNLKTEFLNYNLDLKCYLSFDLIANPYIFNNFSVNFTLNNYVDKNQCNNLKEEFKKCLNDPVESIAQIIGIVFVRLNEFIAKNCISSAERIDYQASTKHKTYLIGRESFTNLIKLNEKFEAHLGDYSFDDEATIYFYIKNLREFLKSLADPYELKKIYCDICCDEVSWPNEFLKLSSCGHEACLNCWREFIKTNVVNMKVTTSFSKSKSNEVKKICCLQDKCDTPIRLGLLKAIVSADLVSKYVKYFTDLTLVKNHNKFVFCKNSKCDKIISIKDRENETSDSRENLVTACQCGYMICNFCLQEQHFPAFCDQIKAYQKYLSELKELKIENEEELYSSEGKNCPKCGSYLEKNMGCNHMSCVCGFQFCWLCLQDFYLYHNASTGYACIYKTVELTKYDSSNFISSRTKLNNVKTFLTQVMLYQRKFRNDTNNDHKIKCYFIRLKNYTIDQLMKHLKQDNQTGLNLIKKFSNIDSANEDSFDLNRRISFILNEKFQQIQSHFYELSIIIEYLALMLSKTNKSFRHSSKSNYSFKSNLKCSLKKAVFYFDSILAILKGFTCLNDSIRLVYFNERVILFAENIKHLTVNVLKIYKNDENLVSLDDDQAE